MKLYVKTLTGFHFEIEVEPDDTVCDVKKNIESSRGQNVYPAEKQMLIHQGKILSDDTTLEQNGVMDSSFLVIILKKNSVTTSAPCNTFTVAQQTVQSPRETVSSEPPAASTPPITMTPAPAVDAPARKSDYGQAASDINASSIDEETVRLVLYIGGGNWNRDAVIRALRAVYNNPLGAIESLCSGMPGQATSRPAVPSSSQPNTTPLNLFPSSSSSSQAATEALAPVGSDSGGRTSILEIMRSHPHYQAVRTLFRAYPDFAQATVREIGKRYIGPWGEEGRRGTVGQPSERGAPGGNQPARQPPAATFTPEEQEAIDRLEAMGFERARAVRAFFACDKNEELAASYLLHHTHGSQ